ncbi:MAG: DUF294 nucleotidyltransferase-like domain-containing protein, partial [Lacunisphaera sp.]
MTAPSSPSAAPTLDFPIGSTAAQRLAACKEYLTAESERIKQRHQAGDSGLKVAQAQAAKIDRLLQQLFTHAIDSWRAKNGEPPTPVCLIALGGYGRSELSPLSDIDVMFLYPDGSAASRPTAFQEFLSNEILYPLWDLRLKIGHSTRTLNEVFSEAGRDIRTKTSLLESRFIAGTESLYENFAAAYRKHYLQDNPKGYIAARLQDQGSRRLQHGDTVFMQEPDIKNGVGGLRDYQNTLWMAKVRLGISRMEELAEQHYLQPMELRQFQRAYVFLLRVRNELHYMSKHPTDVLNLDTQPRLATNLGYPQQKLLELVEALMHDYYRHAQTIYRISKIVEQRLALTITSGPGLVGSLKNMLLARRTERTKTFDGFVLRGRQLAAQKPEIFREDP